MPSPTTIPARIALALLVAGCEPDVVDRGTCERDPILGPDAWEAVSPWPAPGRVADLVRIGSGWLALLSQSDAAGGTALERLDANLGPLGDPVRLGPGRSQWLVTDGTLAWVAGQARPPGSPADPGEDDAYVWRVDDDSWPTATRVFLDAWETDPGFAGTAVESLVIPTGAAEPTAVLTAMSRECPERTGEAFRLFLSGPGAASAPVEWTDDGCSGDLDSRFQNAVSVARAAALPDGSIGVLFRGGPAYELGPLRWMRVTPAGEVVQRPAQVGRARPCSGDSDAALAVAGHRVLFFDVDCTCRVLRTMRFDASEAEVAPWQPPCDVENLSLVPTRGGAVAVWEERPGGWDVPVDAEYEESVCPVCLGFSQSEFFTATVVRRGCGYLDGRGIP